MSLVYVSPFLGGGADWLTLLSPSLEPLCAWMGGKRKLAAQILELLSLSPGAPIPATLGDASWWGWVWPTCLDPQTGPLVSERLRSWRGEDPRALWFRLRDAGPVGEPWEQAAALLWLQSRAASGVPVWWEGHLVSMDGHDYGPYPAGQRRRPSEEGEPVAPKLVQWASTKIDDAGQRQACAKGYIAGASKLSCAHNPPGLARAGGIQDPGTIARRLDAIRWHTARVPWEVHHVDALALTTMAVERHGARARIYLDPPYQGCTGYPATCPRDQVLAIAEIGPRRGAPVVLSEAVPLAADLGSGWTAHCLRGGPKPEWVTCWGCPPPRQIDLLGGL